MKTFDMQPVESSQVHSIGYDAVSDTLAVRFKERKTGAPAALYHYANFTQANFDALRTADSIGSHLHRHVKPHADRFPHTLIESAPASDTPAFADGGHDGAA